MRKQMWDGKNRIHTVQARHAATAKPVESLRWE